MQTELCFHSEFLHIEYLSELSCLYVTKKGNMDFARYVDTVRITLGIIKEKEVTTRIINISELNTLTKLQEKYMEEVYLPELSKQGIKLIIVIVAPQAYNTMLFKRLNKHGIRFEYCDNFETALQRVIDIKNNQSSEADTKMSTEESIAISVSSKPGQLPLCG